MTTLLLVEDDVAMRDRLGAAAESVPGLRLVGAVGTVAEGRARLEEAAPDVLVTDLGLPDGSGTELIERAAGAGVLSMVVTVFGDEQNVLRAISAGASSYLLKDGTPEDFAGAIEQLLAGGSPISPSIARHLLRRFRDAEAPRAPTPSPEVAAEPALLTEREREVLALIAKGFTYAEIADLLGLSAHTVTTHVRKIYRRLAVRSRGEAVYEALQRGLLDVDRL
ncbi:MAG: LuxR C-terminal-related transcriptional regulator [Sandaracinaceae bacterium]